MQYYGYKGLLFLLKTLISLKRVVVWLGQRASHLFRSTGKFYRHFIGFRLHKIGVLFEKRALFGNQWFGQLFAFLESRSALQFIILLLICFLIYPQTRLYSKNLESEVGRETILYKIVGPGDQDQSFDEVEVTVSLPLTTSERRWNEGAVVAESPEGPGGLVDRAPEQIAGISAGGSALTKPTIISGAEEEMLGALKKRTNVVEYEVKSGDTIGQIANQFNLSLATLLWANNLTVRSYIRPGDRLKILPVDGVLHKVVRSDTVSKIAKRYQATPTDIVSFNKLQKDGSDIVIGEILIVPGGELPRPVPVITPRLGSPLKQLVAPPSITVPAGLGYLWPTTVRRISQYFGWRHTGLDIAGPKGTPIYAARAGKVIISKCVRGGYGCYVVIDHGDGVHTLYGHNSQMFVNPGETVSQGQTISLMGSTGRSTGPHVHFEVRVRGKRLNPLKYIR